MRSSARRRLRLFGLAVAVFGLALELVLQLGAAAVAWSTESVETAIAGEPHVLCIGDSFTFGIGASAPERSYPAALERRLAAEFEPFLAEVCRGQGDPAWRDILRGRGRRPTRPDESAPAGSTSVRSSLASCGVASVPNSSCRTATAPTRATG